MFLTVGRLARRPNRPAGRLARHLKSALIKSYSILWKTMYLKNKYSSTAVFLTVGRLARRPNSTKGRLARRPARFVVLYNIDCRVRFAGRLYSPSRVVI